MLGLLYRCADAVRRRSFRSDHGRMGEDLAHRYLRRHGCTIVARNYRTRSGSGEVDIVAWHGPTLVFVEVKTRSTESYGAPDRAVDAEKMFRVRRAASDYARRAGILPERTRFDIVSIGIGRITKVDWIRDAFARV